MTGNSFKILGPGDENALKRYLSPRLETSLFLYSNMLAAGLEDTGATYSGTYAAALEDQRIVAVIGHFWNETMVLQAPKHGLALMKLAQQRCGRPIKRLIGPDEQVSLAIRDLDLSSANLQMDEPEKLYSLDLDSLAIPDLLASKNVRARRIRAEDANLVTRWRAGYFREMHLAPDDDELEKTVRRRVSTEVAAGMTWILEAAGRPVSCTSFNANVKDEGVASIVQVGGVYTPPKQRGRGYARAVVAASLIDARSEGYQKSVLFTGIHNVPAQKAYEALGYGLTGSYRITILRDPIREIA
jgi:ribosomal protein S18 acetylase RimI-like enzyme